MTNSLYKRRGLFVLLLSAAVLGIAPASAQRTSAIGRIDEISHDASYMIINDREFTFRNDKIRVTYRGNPLRLVSLQVGVYIRYETDAGNEIVHAELIGPPQVINELLNK